MSTEFDKSNPLNKFITETLIADRIIKNEPISKDTSTWHKDSGAMLRKDISQITSLALFGKTSSRSLTPAMVSAQEPFAINFGKLSMSLRDLASKDQEVKLLPHNQLY